MDKLRSCSLRSPGNQPNGPHSFQVDDTPYFVYRVVENIFACRWLVLIYLCSCPLGWWSDYLAFV